MKTRPLDAAGRARLRKRFDAIPDKMKRAARAEIDKTTDRMVAQMKLGAPDDEGALRDSIRAEDTSTETWIRVRVSAGGPMTTRPSKGSRPDYDYANAVEYGTADTPPQPFFRPVARREQRAHRNRLRRALKKAAQEG